MVLVVGFVSSCYYDVEDELYGPAGCDTPHEISYTESIVPIIDMSCATTNCHSLTGTAPGNFASYSVLKEAVDNGFVELAVAIDKSMPPSGPLETCDIALIQKWIDQGAPNN